MYLRNKYTKIYMDIVNNAKNCNRKKYRGIYFERHHVVPRSIGGDNTKENLVLLTAREHYICHWLLTKMVNEKKIKNKLARAFWCMNSYSNKRSHERYVGNSRAYKVAREEFSKLQSEMRKRVGGTRTKTNYEVWIEKYGFEEANARKRIQYEKISKTHKERKINVGEKNGMFGKKEDRDHKIKRMRGVLNSRKWSTGLTKETSAKIMEISLKLKGRKVHNSLRCKITNNETGKTWEGESMKDLSRKCKEISHSTIVRLLKKTAGKKIMLRYNVEFV